MDAPSTLSTVAIIVSILALLVSTAISVNQLRLSRRTMQVPSFFDLMAEFRKAEFHNNYNFVVHELQREVDPSGTVSFFEIPEPHRSKVLDVTYFYQNCVSFAGFGLLDESLVMAFLHMRIDAVWRAVEPYVEAERAKTPVALGPEFLGTLEAYAEYARKLSPQDAMKGVRRASDISKAR